MPTSRIRYELSVIGFFHCNGKIVVEDFNVEFTLRVGKFWVL